MIVQFLLNSLKRLPSGTAFMPDFWAMSHAIFSENNYSCFCSWSFGHNPWNKRRLIVDDIRDVAWTKRLYVSGRWQRSEKDKINPSSTILTPTPYLEDLYDLAIGWFSSRISKQDLLILLLTDSISSFFLFSTRAVFCIFLFFRW